MIDKSVCKEMNLWKGNFARIFDFFVVSLEIPILYEKFALKSEPYRYRTIGNC